MNDELSLQATQKWMQQILISPLTFDTDPSFFLPTEYRDDLEKIIAPNKRLSGKQRLEIYQNSYLARLRDCMEKQFTALKHALGSEIFQAFADDYLQRYPSTSYTLNTLGDRLAQFLNETRPDRDLPDDKKEEWPGFIIELVKFEFAINKIFDAILNSDFEYATPKTPDYELDLVDSLKLFSFQFPVNQYYQDILKGNSPQLPLSKPTFTAILRKKSFQIGLLDLNHSQYQFLVHWIVSGSFEDAKSAIINSTGDNHGRFNQIWPSWKKFFIENRFLKVL